MTGRGERTSEELRRGALVTLGEQPDARAVDTLLHGVLSVEWAAARWNSSSGPTVAHRVILTLDAWRLGRLDATPAAHDSLCAALAATVAAARGESLLELVTQWAPDARAADDLYRDAPPPAMALKESLVLYLEGAGDPRLAERVRAGTVERTRSAEVVLRGLRDEASSLPELSQAVRRLLGQPALRVRLA